MAPAQFDTQSVDIAGLPRREYPALSAAQAGQLAESLKTVDYLFRASGSRVRFPGFLSVYEEGKDENGAANGNGDSIDGNWLPALSQGELLDLLTLLPEQHFTQPPPRFTEASLVRALEEHGIGRPSTYAPTMTTLQSRGYVDLKERRLYPTDLGFVVCDRLVKHFPRVFDVGFTARMEEALDSIAEGDQDWVGVLRGLYGPFASRSPPPSI